jgi:peptidyl-prolyl cis-trans isomerase SurA
MRKLGIICFATVLPALLVAQNVAPPQQDTTTHVSSQQSTTASQQARAAASAQDSPATPAPQDKPVVLDSVVAVLNGDVLLESDVEAERRLESLQMLPSDENTDVRAAQHLITRTLILQQMKEQDQSSDSISDSDVDNLIAELRKQLPGCASAHCDTEAGWAGFLAQRGLTPQEVATRWRERLLILNYINLRFRQGIRVPHATVQTYYETNLVPQFKSRHQVPPPLKSLQSRIEEILVQQEVTKQMNDWETTLRQEGSVQILVPAYEQSNTNALEDDDLPGGAM